MLEQFPAVIAAVAAESFTTEQVYNILSTVWDRNKKEDWTAVCLSNENEWTCARGRCSRRGQRWPWVSVCVLVPWGSADNCPHEEARRYELTDGGFVQRELPSGVFHQNNTDVINGIVMVKDQNRTRHWRCLQDRTITGKNKITNWVCRGRPW